MNIEYNTTILLVLLIYFIAIGLVVGLIMYFYRDKK